MGFPWVIYPRYWAPWLIRGYPQLIRDPRCCTYGNSCHHVASPEFPASLTGTLPSILLQRGCPLMGIPFQMTVRGSCHSKFINIFVLSYISIILLASSKSVHTKISEIKCEKNMNLYKTANRSIPLNTVSNGRELSWWCSIFTLG